MQYFDTFSKLRIQSPCLYTYGVFFVNLYITQHCALWKMCNRINTIQEWVSLQEDYAGYRQSRSNQWIERNMIDELPLFIIEEDGCTAYYHL